MIATAVAVAPSTALTDNDLNCLIAATKSGQVLLFIDTVMDIELKSAGFAKKYCEAAYEWLLAKTEYANRFFLPLFRSNNSTTILNTCFGNCENALQKIYETHILDDNFDYFAVLFKFLDEKGNNPVDILFNCLANVSDVSNRYKIIRRLGHVSQLYNPEQRLRKVVHRLVSCSRFSAYDVSTLLINNEYLLENFDVSDFIFTELERGLQEGCVPECYSEALLYIPLSKRKEPYITLLRKDPEGKLLKVLPFDAPSYSGTVEEGFTPAYRSEIDIIQSISKSLPKDKCFNYHRNRLYEVICEKERKIEQERWRRFHKVF